MVLAENAFSAFSPYIITETHIVDFRGKVNKCNIFKWKTGTATVTHRLKGTHSVYSAVQFVVFSPTPDFTYWEFTAYDLFWLAL